MEFYGDDDDAKGMAQLVKAVHKSHATGECFRRIRRVQTGVILTRIEKIGGSDVGYELDNILDLKGFGEISSPLHYEVALKWRFFEQEKFRRFAGIEDDSCILRVVLAPEDAADFWDRWLRHINDEGESGLLAQIEMQMIFEEDFLRDAKV